MKTFAIFLTLSLSAFATDFKQRTEAEWKKSLTPEQFEVCRQAGTERPFTGKYNSNKAKGVYVCGLCGQELFTSETKFDSGTGWPSFFDGLAKDRLELKRDDSIGVRTEVRCSRCGAHLGHVFDDGPAPTHKRYCINSVCLGFVPKP